LAKLNLALLGGFQARLDFGPPLLLPAKAQALLAYLAARPGQAHPRDKLAGLLWGGTGNEQARSNLRHTLFDIRQAVRGVSPAPLVTEQKTVALGPGALDTDVLALERLVAEDTLPALEQAAALYQGDLLEGLSVDEPPYEEWLLSERERLRERAMEVFARLLVHQRTAGASEAALQTGLRLLGLDPLQESVHRTLMRLYADLGRRGAALRQYQQCVAMLQRELGLAPETETKRVYQEILRMRPEPRQSERLLENHGAPIQGPDASPPSAFLSESPLVGREAERARLRDLLDAAVAGRGRLVAVHGEAGIGKTRLVMDLADAAARRRAVVLIGRSYETEKILPFGPWIDAFRAGQVGRDLDDGSVLESTLRGELAAFLGTPPAGAANYRQLFDAVAQLARRLAARQPLIVILEDLHWADEMSLRLLAFLGRRLEGWPVLLVATAREEEFADAPLLRRTLEDLAHDDVLASVALEPLSRAETLALVETLARVGSNNDVMLRLGELVWLASAGNPFVVVETMRSLGEDMASVAPATLPVPRRVLEVVTRRLERLSEPARQLAAVAAVAGRDFDFALVQRAAGLGEDEAAQAMEELVRRRLLHGLGERFDFAHQRIRQAAYSQLLPPRRRLLHRRVAEALETLHGDDLRPHDLALGLHYREAELWDKAARHLHQAGAHAAARWAHREAAACFEQALGALERLPRNRDRDELAVDLRHSLYVVLWPLAEFAQCLNHLRQAVALAEGLEDRPRLAKVRTSLAMVLGEVEPGEAVAVGRRACELAADLDDVPTQILANIHLADALFARGEYDETITSMRWNLRVPEKYYSRPKFGGTNYLPLLSSQTYLVFALAERGAFAEGIEVAEAALRTAVAVDRPLERLWVSIGAGRLYLLNGGFERTITLLELALPLVARGELPLHFPRAASTLGFAYVLAGRLADGLALLEQAVARGVTIQKMYGHALALALRGEARLMAGRPDDATSDASEALQLAQRRGERGWEAWAWRLSGEIHTRRDPLNVELADAPFRQALVLAMALGMRPLIARCHDGLGKLYRRTGKREQAQNHLTTATTMYREMGMQFWLEKTEKELGELR